MGYYLSDERGYVADGPSLTGWARLRDRVLLTQGGPATHAFVEHGFTEDVASLGSELSRVTAGTDAPVAHSLEALLEAVRRSRGIVILGTGVSSWPDDAED